MKTQTVSCTSPVVLAQRRQNIEEYFKCLGWSCIGYGFSPDLDLLYHWNNSIFKKGFSERTMARVNLGILIQDPQSWCQHWAGLLEHTYD